WIGPSIGEKIAVGSVIVKLEVADGAAPAHKVQAAPPAPKATPAPSAVPDAALVKAADMQRAPPPESESARPREAVRAAVPSPAQVKPAERPLAAPVVRAFARDAGVDLRFVKGSGPAGRILYEDVEAYIST